MTIRTGASVDEDRVPDGLSLSHCTTGTRMTEILGPPRVRLVTGVSGNPILLPEFRFDLSVVGARPGIAKRRRRDPKAVRFLKKFAFGLMTEIVKSWRVT